MDQALRFKAMYSRLGFTVADVARFLQVTPRTVHAWISGRVRIPFAAYKLLRIQLHYELPGDAWNGWHISAGRLYTPENHELRPQDFAWWGLLVRKASMFMALYEQYTRAGRTAARPAALAQPGRPAGSLASPATAGGRAPQAPGPNSFLEHFRKSQGQNLGNMRVPAVCPSDVHVNLLSQHGKGAGVASKRPQKKRSRQVGRNTVSGDISKIVQEESSKLKRDGKWKPVGSPLLHGLLGPSRADVAALAAREWDKVTNGAGVVLVDGKPVDVKGGDSI